MDANLLRLHDRHVAQIGHDFIRLLILQSSVRDGIDDAGAAARARRRQNPSRDRMSLSMPPVLRAQSGSSKLMCGGSRGCVPAGGWPRQPLPDGRLAGGVSYCDIPLRRR